MTGQKAKFLEGDLMRHVAVMSFSASAGLLSIFLVDFVDLYFISLLGEAALAAAAGFAGTLLFFNMAISIGLMIAVSALAARHIGRGDPEEARQVATSVMAVGLIISTAIACLFWILTPEMLDLIGATGETKDYATSYLRIVVPSFPVAIVAMIASGLLRAHGDARRAMQATLAAGIVNAALDPVFIFALGMGLDGAAVASVCARLAMVVTAILPVVRIYGGFAPFNREKFLSHLNPVFGIAIPAILTNVATPVGNVIVTRAVAPFGDAAMAGYAVIGRLTPLVFCVIFALSGAVGPIIGQNFGAGKFDRVRGTLIKALQFTLVYTGVVWVLLMIAAGPIATAFSLSEDGRRIVEIFALIITPLFFFNGALFIANASFNNLNRPVWSTLLNWGKNTIGVIPFVWYGAKWGGASGVLVGQAVGGIVFALAGIWLAWRLSADYEAGRISQDTPKRSGWMAFPASLFSRFKQ